VVRAEITSARLLDQAGRVVFAPQIAAARAGATSTPATPPFDAAKADVAGLRVGVRARDMEATLTRLFGKVTRSKPFGHMFPGFVGTLEMNPDGCMSMIGQRRSPQPGAVCVRAFVDRDEVVRIVQIERLFSRSMAKRFAGRSSRKRPGSRRRWRSDDVGPVAWPSGNPEGFSALTARYAIDRTSCLAEGTGWQRPHLASVD
jgi:hypothetical protein